MVKHFDHLTIVVRDIDQAKAFFSALGFAEAISVVISGEQFASYMGVPGIEAEHVTLVLENAFTPAQLCDAMLAAQAVKHDADLLLG